MVEPALSSRKKVWSLNATGVRRQDTMPRVVVRRYASNAEERDTFQNIVTMVSDALCAGEMVIAMIIVESPRK